MTQVPAEATLQPTRAAIGAASAGDIPDLSHPKRPSPLVHALLRAGLRIYALAIRVAGRLGPTPRPRPAGGYDILLTGTFFSDNWVRSHLLPLAGSSYCARVRMVATARVPPIPKVEGVYPPRRLIRAVGSVPARLLYFTWLALRTRPHIVGGFHLLVNGLVAALMARVVGARSLYFSVGGPVELLDGGCWGENRIFARMGSPDAVVERKLLDAVGSCDLVVTMGTRAIAFFRTRGLTTRFHVVSGGIDPLRFSPAASDAREYDVILCCRLVPIKRVDLFLRAVARVAETLPRVRAVIVGDGPLRAEMEALAVELGITSNVTFAGERSDVENWLRRSRLFMLTSDSEGLSLSLMEAMMAGLPAVVSRVGDLGDLVEDGVNGWLVAERTPDGFARPVMQLLGDGQLLRRFSAAAAAAGAANRPGEVTRRWDQILGSLDASPPRPIPAARALSRKNVWERVPSPARRVLEPALSRLSPRLLLGPRFSRDLAFVREAEAWGEEQIRRYQVAQLRSLCAHAMQRTPYYRELFGRVGFDPRDLTSPDQIQALPTLDRDTVRDQLDSLCAFTRARRVDYVSTSGSSGEPLRFYINADRSSFEYAHLVAGWSRAGFRLGMPLGVFRGRLVAADRTGLHHEYDPLLRHHYYSSFHLNADQIPRYLEHIRTLGPCYLHVYPSSVSALANYLRSTGEEPPRNVLGVLAESEIVEAHDSSMVSNAFGCGYFSSYGLTEKVVAAAACERSANYHVWPTYGFFELLDGAGRRITTQGERGEIVGTGFINTAMPFIRYRTGDFATYVGERCEACGRAHTVIADIRGRRPQEWLVARDASLIAWTALNAHDDTFENVLSFQFYQDTPGRATLRVVPSSGFSETDAARISRRLGAKLDGAVEFTLELVSSICLSERGKALYVDQRLLLSR